MQQKNAAILATQILALGDVELHEKFVQFKETLKDKVVKANEELSKVSFPYKVN